MPSDDRRYPPPPPPPATSHRSSFIGHHLPPLISSASSPHSYPSPGASQTDPAGWASDRDRDYRSSSNTAGRGRYSPVMPPFDRPPSSSSNTNSRLPPFDSYHRSSISSIPNVGGWDSSNAASGFPGWNTGRPSFPFSNASSSPSKAFEARSGPPILARSGAAAALTDDATQSSSAVDNASNSNKHPSDETPNSGKKKKRRVALSCAECAKRKQKCNRQTPCQHCVARRVPELCIPYTRATSPKPKPSQVKAEDGKGGEVAQPRAPSALPTLSVRVARIEALLNVVVNKVDGLEGKALSDWRINHAPATSPVMRHSSLTASRRESARESPSPSTSPPPTAIEERESGDGASDEVAGLDIDSSMRNPLPQSMQSEKEVLPGLDYHGTPAEQLQKLFNDHGVSPEQVHELLRDLPIRSHGDRMLDWFFRKVNYVRYPIDEHLFRKSFEELYASTSMDAPSVIFLPLVYIVFSISTRVAPDEWGMPEDEKRTQSLRFYWNSKKAVLMAQAIKAENVPLVETKILTGLYLVLMHERRLAEGWTEFRNALAIAQALGLHRDGTKLRLDPYTTEYRRRLWSYLVHADATYSCLMGRPTALDSRFCDTALPSNLDLTALLDDPKARPRPHDEPTFATYLILRRGLGEIVSRLTEHFQMLEYQTQYRDVEEIDAEFKAFIADLPAAFRMRDPDKSWDDQLWYLPVHRYYIQTEILHYIIILHRPYLLRKLRSSRYSLSRSACIEAAALDFKIRQAFQRDVPDFFETLLASSFREFNAAMIAGISIIIDPRSIHSSDMRAILQKFLEDHPHDPSMDDFSQKESAIIYTLHQRAKEFEEKRLSDSMTRPRSSSIRMTQDNISAERNEPIPSGRNGADAPFMIGKSPLSGFQQKQSPLHGSAAGSPDDDQPQQLLNHWLMSNSFGPPLAQDPSQAIYQSNGYQNIPVETYAQPGQWSDSNTGANAGLGMGILAPQAQMGYVPSGNGFGNQNNMAPMGGQWGDGNSAQYWNTLIDNISANVGPKFEMNIPSA